MRDDSNQRLLDWILAQPECEWIEYKRSWFDPGAIGRYVSGLSNSARIWGQRSGYLVWGVDNYSAISSTCGNRSRRITQSGNN